MIVARRPPFTDAIAAAYADAVRSVRRVDGATDRRPTPEAAWTFELE